MNMSIVQQWIDFLRTWKFILNEVQKRNIPSLFSVLPCIAFLKEDDSLNREEKGRTWYALIRCTLHYQVYHADIRLLFICMIIDNGISIALCHKTSVSFIKFNVPIRSYAYNRRVSTPELQSIQISNTSSNRRMPSNMPKKDSERS
jgi:hypothetical protein